jgi:hypothetical protein
MEIARFDPSLCGRLSRIDGIGQCRGRLSDLDGLRLLHAVRQKKPRLRSIEVVRFVLRIAFSVR